jgi:hypothetical protein
MATRRILRNKRTKPAITRKNGGHPVINFFANVGNLRKDQNVSKHYYETEIEVDRKKYKINYFTPSNKLFKSTDNTFVIPKFHLHINHAQPKDYSLKIGDSVYINSIIILNKGWYVITRSIDHIKTKTFTTFIHKIRGVFKHAGNDELHVNPRACTIQNDTIQINEKNVIQINEEHKYFKILSHFDNQQFVGQVAKEDVALEVGFEAADELI